MENPSDGTVNVECRIKELGEKATQLLTFLSFAIAGVLILADKPDRLGHCQQVALRLTLRFWAVAFLPILANILPVKEFCWDCPQWYKTIRWGKVVLLWAAVCLIICGVITFLCAVW
jgi:hypothetical protein